MDCEKAEKTVCRDLCVYHKPDRTEEERCRGFTLARNMFMKDAPALLESDPQFDPTFSKDLLYENICAACPFLVDGCDFTDPDGPEDCLPCGGMVLLSRLLNKGAIDQDQIIQANILEKAKNSFLALSPMCSVKRLEEDYLYHVGNDELYEINEEALEFIEKCNGEKTAAELGPDPEFLGFCLQEGLLAPLDEPESRPVKVGKSPVPSLRYLEWLITFRCNLSCHHCYLGASQNTDFPEDLIEPLLREFSDMGGLRIMVTGGEPTLYPFFSRLNQIIPDYPVRFVLLSNGLTMDHSIAKKLNFHEVQLSLDGLEQGHDSIRGKGSFKKVQSAMKAVTDAGLDLSVATMIHKGNLHDFNGLKELVEQTGAVEWNIDYPCVEGRWHEHPDLAVDPLVAAKMMEYGFGGAYHGSASGWTCGRHLAGVIPTGDLCRCGLYQARTYGSIRDGLKKAWLNIEHIPISETECSECEHGDICAGGCRFRAGGRTARDEVMCRLYGVLDKD